jgi:hypothetical protein
MIFQGVAISHVTLQNIVIFFLLYRMSFFLNSSSADDVNSGAFVIFKRSQTSESFSDSYIYFKLFTQKALKNKTKQTDLTHSRLQMEKGTGLQIAILIEHTLICEVSI